MRKEGEGEGGVNISVARTSLLGRPMESYVEVCTMME